MSVKGAHTSEAETAAPESSAANCRCTHGERPPDDASRYIHACHRQAWKLATWRKDGSGDVSWKPARCYSWRHAGPCAEAKSAQDYVRIKEALGRHERAHISYLVLTLDPSAWTGNGWARPGPGGVERRPDAKHDNSAISAAYPALLDRWRMFAQAVRRKWGAFSYVSTVESHRSGWPHLNVVIVSPAMSRDIALAEEDLGSWKRKAKGREVARRCFGDMLERTGFGKIAFLEPALSLGDEDEDRLAKYISKLAGETGQAWDGEGRGLVDSIEGQVVAEIAKLSQVPVRAPEGFRRLRSSKGFLPPAAKSDEGVTGAIFDEHGDTIGRSAQDRVIAAAYRAEGQARDLLAIQIADEIDAKMARIGEVGQDDIVQGPRLSMELRKLFRASRVLEGIDGEQLLLAARAAVEAGDLVAAERIGWRVADEIEKDNERRQLHRKMVKESGESRFASMRSDSDRAKLRAAAECLRNGEVDLPSVRRLLSPQHATEVTSRGDIEEMSRTWGGGPGMFGPAARRYRLKVVSSEPGKPAPADELVLGDNGRHHRVCDVSGDDESAAAPARLKDADPKCS